MTTIEMQNQILEQFALLDAPDRQEILRLAIELSLPPISSRSPAAE